MKKYFILPKNHHIIPISNLDPQSLKQAAKERLINNQESIKHTTVLNAIAKFLGANGGFQGYKKHYNKIQSFQQDHGMSHFKDLISSQSHFSPKPQQISERFFCSGKALPKSLFTGFDFDWHNCDNITYNARLLPIAEDYREYTSCFNLLGDSLISPPEGDGYIPTRYFQLPYNDSSKKQEIQICQNIFRGFRRNCMESSSLGWVDVIPFNENLIFLKAPDGGFDFVFRNQRDSLPPKRFQMLNSMDIAKSLESQGNFALIDYFRINSWSEMEEHKSEEFFYKSGGTSSTYPGLKEIKEAYLRKTGKLPLPISITRHCSKSHPNFSKIQMENDSVCVSNLISIQEFHDFMKDSQYELRRRGRWDNLESVNLDSGDLPVCVNWYDANSYAAWFERKFDLPVRLLRIQEYLQIYPHPAEKESDIFEKTELNNDTISNSIYDLSNVNVYRLPNENDVKFYYPNGKPFDYKYIDEDDFQKIHVRWGENLAFKQNQQGIKFLISWRFGEWLYENHETQAASVNTRTLNATYQGGTLKGRFFPAFSCGKYKYCKIGFRLCYTSAD